MKTFTTREVAELLAMSRAEVRSHARAGYLRPARGPRNAYRFSFQDVVLLRTARALAAARLPGRRIRRALRGLARQLPGGRPLSEVRIASEGERVVVRDGDTVWQPDSGQVLLDFSVRELASKVAPLARRNAETARRTSDGTYNAAQWFALGCELEAMAPADARDAYRRALELEPAHADAHVNLGRLLQETGAIAAALEHYQAALTADPACATAAFNLGVAYEDLGRRREAIAAYGKAIEIDPELRDAHFNLSRIYERSGKRTAALRHLSRYKQLLEGKR